MRELDRSINFSGRSKHLVIEYLFLFGKLPRHFIPEFRHSFANSLLRLNQVILALKCLVELPLNLLDDDRTCLERHDVKNDLNLFLTRQLHLYLLGSEESLIFGLFSLFLLLFRLVFSGSLHFLIVIIDVSAAEAKI